VLTRRELLGSLTAFAACSRRDPPAAVAVAGPAASSAPAPVSTAAPVTPAAPVDSAPSLGQTELVTWTLPERGSNGEAVVILPADGAPSSTRWPLLILLHGRGEALKGPHDGALGWAHDYALIRQISRVNNPPLGEDDVEGFVDQDRLDYYNHQLAARPFQGLVIVCPYVPDTNLHNHADLSDYARYVADVLVPRARKELPVFAAPESTGIDGVSLGGAIALRTGFARTDTFGAVAALQPAVADFEAQEWVELAKAARAKRRDMPLRLTTSHDDLYHDAISHLSAALRSAGVAHDFADIPGPHDYPFNRGPGAIEVLLWHDRVLSRG
jgi:enterochelin esterase-like enzyme